MEIRVAYTETPTGDRNTDYDNAKLTYHPREDEKYVIKLPSGFEFEIPDFTKTVSKHLDEDEKSFEVVFPKENEENYGDDFPHADVFGDEDREDYIGYLSCDLLTGKWGDGKSFGSGKFEIIPIVEQAEQRYKTLRVRAPKSYGGL